jgi:hypothetical protein
MSLSKLFDGETSISDVNLIQEEGVFPVNRYSRPLRKLIGQPNASLSYLPNSRRRMPVNSGLNSAFSGFVASRMGKNRQSGPCTSPDSLTLRARLFYDGE